MRPLILVSNDDGWRARGVQALAGALEALGEVWVVAPEDEQSGVSSSITLRDPLRITERAPRRYSVSGTPADCAYVSINRLLPRRPALCVSGVNHGANLGDDVIYSGTVAAAVEATLHGVPSIAVSLAAWGDEHDFEPAALIAGRVAERALARGLPRDTLLNLNVPPGAAPEAAIEVCGLGRRNYQRAVTRAEDPRGGAYYWIGGREVSFDDLPGSDCNVVARGLAALAPVRIDMTDYRFRRELGGWFEPARRPAD